MKDLEDYKQHLSDYVQMLLDEAEAESDLDLEGLILEEIELIKPASGGAGI